MAAMGEKTNAVNETLQLPLADALEADLNAALEDNRGVVLAVIDLDHFLAVNEQFGFAVGDRVLIETGEYLRGRLTGGAKLYRYAGDEFAILYPEDLEKEDVFLLMEEARKGYDVRTPDGEKQTISIGIALAIEDGTRFHELVRKAEGAMIRGKLSGRNRVCLAREEKMVTKTAHYTFDQLQRLTKVSKREGIGEAILLREALDALLKKYDA